MMLVGIPSSEVLRCWPLAWSFLQEAAAYAIEPTEEVEVCRALLNREAQLWAVVQESGEAVGFGVTKVEVSSVGKGVLLWLFSGKDTLSLLQEVSPTLEDWAKAQGGTYLRLHGRPGWQRALRPHAWKLQAVELIRYLEVH